MSILGLLALSLIITGDPAFALAGAGNSTSSSVGMVSSGWYAGWHSNLFPLSQISWEKYTHLYYAFGTPTADVSILGLADSDAELIPQFVSLARKNNVKASLSIGGWAGSIYFSSAVGSAANRTAFVKTITDVVTKYSLDGIDFDWEYPNKQGMGCNTISTDDTPNFLSFLQELRRDPIGKDILLTAAVGLLPFNSTSSTPSTDVSPFADVLDWIEIMNYDVWTYAALSSAPPDAQHPLRAGPSAPLDDSCVADPRDRVGSATSAVKAWTGAGFPANKILLGVPYYGHSFVVDRKDVYVNETATATTTTTIASSTVTTTSVSVSLSVSVSTSTISASHTPKVHLAKPATNSTKTLKPYPPINVELTKANVGDKWDSAETWSDACGVIHGASGVYNFFGLIDTGFLNKNGEVNQADGILLRRDDCSETPYVYNPKTHVMVSFDDPTSFAAKGDFIKASNLKGFAAWEIASDKDDLLLDAIRNAMVNGDPNRQKSGSGATSQPSASSSPAPDNSATVLQPACVFWTSLFVMTILILN